MPQQDIVVLRRSCNNSVGGKGWSYGMSCSITMYDRRLGPYLERVVDRGWVIDFGHLEFTSELFKAIFYGPEVDIGFKDGQREESDMDQLRDDLKRMMPGLDGQAKAVGALLLANEHYKDVRLSPNLFATHQKELGARVGQRIGDEIVWCDGEREPVEGVNGEHPCDKRTAQ